MKYVTVLACQGTCPSAIIFPEHVSHCDAVDVRKIPVLSAGFFTIVGGKTKVDKTHRSNSLNLGPRQGDEELIDLTILLMGTTTSLSNVMFVLEDYEHALKERDLFEALVRDNVLTGECYCGAYGVASKERCEYCKMVTALEFIESRRKLRKLVQDDVVPGPVSVESPAKGQP